MPLSSPDISKEAQKEFKQNKQRIIDSLVERLLAEPGAFDHLGEQAENTLRAGFEFTSSSLEACMQINDMSLLANQLSWAKDRLPHDGISMDRMQKNIQEYCRVISEVIPQPYAVEIVNVVQKYLLPSK